MNNPTVVSQLRKAGVDASPYSRGPAGKRPFMMSVEPKGKGVIKLWEGEAKIEVVGDKEQRQAVLNVKELPHTVKKRVSRTRVYFDSLDLEGKGKDAAPKMKDVHNSLQTHFGVNMPFGTVYTCSDVKVERHTYKDEATKKIMTSANYWNISGLVTARTSVRRPMSFLVGRDEKYAFIALLPEKAASVAEAHEILRPDDVPVGSTRQGEWFFVPVSKTLAEKLDRIARTQPNKIYTDGLESDSTHTAKQLLVYEKKKYAIGYIHDDRVTHHKGLYLEGWHRVVRNREKVMPVLERNRRASWD